MVVWVGSPTQIGCIAPEVGWLGACEALSNLVQSDGIRNPIWLSVSCYWLATLRLAL